jgi:hypothetical protein
MEGSSQFLAPAAGKSPRYPLDGRLSEPQSRPERRGEEEFLDPIGTRIPASRYSSP